MRVFPAFSELVMLYAGAVAGGRFRLGAPVSLFGANIHFGIGAFFAIALAGTLGYLVGALIGWGIGRTRRAALLQQHGRWFHVTRSELERAERWFDR